jgi:hypothetical protein
MRVKVEARYKKSVEEIEWYRLSDTNIWAQRETLWRWGTFYVTMDEEEYNRLVEDSKEDTFEMSTEITAYEDFDLWDCWDGISCDTTIYSHVEAEKEKAKELQKKMEDEIEDEYDWDYYEWLETHEFYQDGGYEVWIHGPLTLTIEEEE